MTGLAVACLQWGPLCLLALMGSEIQIAHYAVVTRTAMVIDFLIPAAILVPHGFLLHSKLADAMHTAHGKLWVDLMVSLATTTICVAAVAVVTPWIVDLYGLDYTRLTELFVLLFATQWLNGAGRPAIRHLAANWNFKPPATCWNWTTNPANPSSPSNSSKTWMTGWRHCKNDDWACGRRS